MLETQNHEENIRKLKAQRALYSSAKVLSGAQLFFSVIAVVFISVGVLLFSKGWIIRNFGWSKGDYSWVLATYSFCIIFIDLLILTPLIDYRKECAAKIQQLFDSDVLNFKWDRSFYGEKPINETIIIWANKYKGSESGLINWYSQKTIQLPEDVCRIVCQRANCWWDSKVRNRYNTFIYIIGGFLVITLLLISLAVNIDIQGFFSTLLAPLTPFFIFAVKTISDNKKVIVRLNEVIEELNGKLDKILSENHDNVDLFNFSNSIQYSIFLNRKESPLIFDFIYNYSRIDDEETVNVNAEDYVTKYQRITGGSK